MKCITVDKPRQAAWPAVGIVVTALVTLGLMVAIQERYPEGWIAATFFIMPVGLAICGGFFAWALVTCPFRIIETTLTGEQVNSLVRMVEVSRLDPEIALLWLGYGETSEYDPEDTKKAVDGFREYGERMMTGALAEQVEQAQENGHATGRPNI